MKTFLSLTLVLVASASVWWLSRPPASSDQPAGPPALIFDTDMGNDIDDAMALAMIFALEQRGACTLLAVTSSKDHPKSAPFIDALHHFYGRPEVPVGAVRKGVTPDEGRFLGLIDQRDAQGNLRYPRKLQTGEDAPEAVALMRKTLAARPNQSVILVQVGFFTNLARLMASEPDEHSPLSGMELLREKVRETVVMAGAFQSINHETLHLEYNVRMDIISAVHVAERWPTPMVWSGYEIGLAAPYPWKSIEEDYNSVPTHVIKEAYLAYAPSHPHDRPTWDLTAVLYAVYPERGYFGRSPKGTVSVTSEGRTEFKTDANGRHRFLLMDAVQAARVREAFVHLCASLPPTKGAKP
jgi:inosine-uridine nucleoside N-ribohydrolase